MQKSFVRKFEVIMFELKYDVVNDTEEQELVIEIVHSFKKNLFHELVLYVHFTKYYFSKQEESNEIQRIQEDFFCPRHYRIFIFLCALKRIKLS